MRAVFLAAALLSGTAASAQLRPDQAAFRGLFKELVETNTTVSAGSCTLAAERMATRLKAAGFGDGDIRLFNGPKDRPQDGGLVATLAGKDAKSKAILLLAHIDVVEAKRADWERDPFTLIEEGGWFYGRGTSDDKAQAAIFTDTLIRLKQSGKTPKRTLKMALTCGEESPGVFNGAEWLMTEHKDWIDAEFALNEGGIGASDDKGSPLKLAFQAGEKVYQDFRLEARNPGGHSSQPRPDNAIYQLTAGLNRLAATEFPVQFTDASRAYFTAMAGQIGGEVGAAMQALLANPADASANAIVSRDPNWHSMLRTTCVATRLDAGHANNALAQRASANINCRMFPGDSLDKVRGQIIAAVADPGLALITDAEVSPTPPPPPLTPAIYDPAVALAKKYYPGVPLLPTLVTGATDGRFLSAGGIPTYGVPGMVADKTLNNVHGLNERISVSNLYTTRDYLFDLINAYAAK